MYVFYTFCYLKFKPISKHHKFKVVIFCFVVVLHVNIIYPCNGFYTDVIHLHKYI